MASFNELPVEVMTEIAGYLSDASDLTALSATSHLLYSIVMSKPILFSKTDSSVREYGLLLASLSGQTKAVKLLLDSGADPNVYHSGALKKTESAQSQYYASGPWNSSRRETDVDVATCSQADVISRVNDQLRRGWRSRKYWTSWYATPLHLAAHMGHDEIVDLLLERGANVNLSSMGVCQCRVPEFFLNDDPTLSIPPQANPPWSSLHLAICGKHMETAKLIIGHGAPMYLNSRPWPSYKTYSRSASDTFMLTAHEVLRLGYDAVKKIFGTTPAEAALTGKRQWTCYEWLVAKELNIQQANNRHILEESWHSCSDSDACQLISYGIDIQLVWAFEGISKPLIHICLQRACGPLGNWRRDGASSEVPNAKLSERGIPMLELLVGKGADVNQKDPCDLNSTLLMIAARNGNESGVEFLLRNGVDVKAADNMGYTALHAACVSRKDTIIIMLAESGAQMDAVTNTGLTPLHFLCSTLDPYRRSYRRLTAIEFLIHHGASTEFRGNFPGGRRSALEVAFMMSDVGVARLLHSKYERPLSEEEIWSLFRATIRAFNFDCLYYLLQIDKKRVILRSDQSLLRLLRSSPNTAEAEEVLLDRGAPCNGASTEDGGNTVFWAVRNQKNPDLLERLLQNGVNPNVVVKTKARVRCPLLQALKIRYEFKRRRYLKLLLDHGADINLRLGPGRDPIPLYVHMIQPQLLHKTESVKDLLFQPLTLEKIPEDEQVTFMKLVCRLSHVRIFHILLKSSSDVVIRKFVDQFAKALPVSSLLDVSKYEKAPDYRIERMDLVLDSLRHLGQYGASWACRGLETEPRPIDILQQLMTENSDDSPASIGVRWYLRRNITIANADSDTPEVTISWPTNSGGHGRRMKLGALGVAVEKEMDTD